jgi:hypothetical protein
MSKRKPPITIHSASKSDLDAGASVEIFPAGAQMRLCSVTMALDAAIALANEAGNHKVLGILDLIYAELNRLNDEVEELEAAAPAHRGSADTGEHCVAA